MKSGYENRNDMRLGSTNSKDTLGQQFANCVAVQASKGREHSNSDTSFHVVVVTGPDWVGLHQLQEI